MVGLDAAVDVDNDEVILRAEVDFVEVVVDGDREDVWSATGKGIGAFREERTLLLVPAIVGFVLDRVADALVVLDVDFVDVLNLGGGFKALVVVATVGFEGGVLIAATVEILAAVDDDNVVIVVDVVEVVEDPEDVAVDGDVTVDLPVDRVCAPDVLPSI